MTNYAKNCAEGTNLQKGKGAQAMADCWNKLELYSSSDKQLSRTVITDALNAGRIGVSPPKIVKPVKVVPDITSQFGRGAAMMQASGTGEATYAKMDKKNEALTVGTSHADTLNSKYTFCKARMAHPEIFNPVMAKNDDDRRIEWLTFKNINDWTDAVKEELVQIGMVKKELGIISELLSTVPSLLAGVSGTISLQRLSLTSTYRWC